MRTHARGAFKHAANTLSLFTHMRGLLGLSDARADMST